MSFKLNNFGSDSNNAKSILGGISYFRYFNKDNNDITIAGFFPANLGLSVGDRISVIPADVTNGDELYIVTDVTNRVVTVSKASNGGETNKQYLEQVEEMPEATESNLGRFIQFVGATGDYTNGFIYVNKTSTSYDSTVEFNPASISGTTVACSGSDFASLVQEYGSGNITDIITGTLTYDESGEILVFVGKDDTDTTVCTFQLYTQDYEDAGFTFTGTLANGDVITFSCAIEEITNYGWVQANVQPTE